MSINYDAVAEWEGMRQHTHSPVADLSPDDRRKLGLAIDLMDQIAEHLLSHTHYPNLLGYNLGDRYWGLYQNLDTFFRFLGPVCTGEFLHAIHRAAPGPREVVVRIVDGRAVCFSRDAVEDAGCKPSAGLGRESSGCVGVPEGEDAIQSARLGREFPLPDLLDDVLPEEDTFQVRLLPLNAAPVAGQYLTAGRQEDGGEVEKREA